jgi:hypothetical protein
VVKKPRKRIAAKRHKRVKRVESFLTPLVSFCGHLLQISEIATDGHRFFIDR